MKKIFIVPLLLSLFLAGCGGGRQAVTRYYLLEYPVEKSADQPLQGQSGLLPYSCFVAPVEIHPAFATHQIAIREQANQINYFSFNEWAVRPTQSLTKLALKFLQNNELFGRVTDSQLVPRNDFIFETYVSRIDMTMDRRDFIAHLAVEFRLVNNETGQTIAIHHTENQRRLEEKNLNEFAAAISEMFVNEMNVFARQLTIHPNGE